MPRYAQIDGTGKCFAVSFLSGEVESDDMIPLSDTDDVAPGDTYQDGVWTKYVPPAPTLEDVKRAKMAELMAARDAVIYTSFTSDALGSVRTYNYSREAAGDFRAKTALLGLATSIQTIPWYTSEDGLISHTREQFAQVVMDGANHEEPLKMHYFALESAVILAQTEEEVAAIVW
jgi:hypothetical protein